MPTAILLAHGPLGPRLPAALNDFVYQRGVRIVYHDQIDKGVPGLDARRNL